MINETRTLEEKVNKAMIDAACLADELHAEQENTQHEQRKRQSLECHVHDMQVNTSVSNYPRNLTGNVI